MTDAIIADTLRTIGAPSTARPTDLPGLVCVALERARGYIDGDTRPAWADKIEGGARVWTALAFEPVPGATGRKPNTLGTVGFGRRVDGLWEVRHDDGTRGVYAAEDLAVIAPG